MQDKPECRVRVTFAAAGPAEASRLADSLKGLLVQAGLRVELEKHDHQQLDVGTVLSVLLGAEVVVDGVQKLLQGIAEWLRGKGRGASVTINADQLTISNVDRLTPAQIANIVEGFRGRRQ